MLSVQVCVGHVDKSKTQLEHYRVQKAMQGDTSQTMDDTEADLKDALDQAKRR